MAISSSLINKNPNVSAIGEFRKGAVPEIIHRDGALFVTHAFQKLVSEAVWGSDGVMISPEEWEEYDVKIERDGGLDPLLIQPCLGRDVISKVQALFIQAIQPLHGQSVNEMKLVHTDHETVIELDGSKSLGTSIDADIDQFSRDANTPDVIRETYQNKFTLHDATQVCCYTIFNRQFVAGFQFPPSPINHSLSMQASPNWTSSPFPFHQEAIEPTQPFLSAKELQRLENLRLLQEQQALRFKLLDQLSGQLSTRIDAFTYRARMRFFEQELTSYKPITKDAPPQLEPNYEQLAVISEEECRALQEITNDTTAVIEERKEAIDLTNQKIEQVQTEISRLESLLGEPAASVDQDKLQILMEKIDDQSDVIKAYEYINFS